MWFTQVQHSTAVQVHFANHVIQDGQKVAEASKTVRQHTLTSFTTLTQHTASLSTPIITSVTSADKRTTKCVTWTVVYMFVCLSFVCRFSPRLLPPPKKNNGFRWNLVKAFHISQWSNRLEFGSNPDYFVITGSPPVFWVLGIFTIRDIRLEWRFGSESKYRKFGLNIRKWTLNQ